MNTLLLPLLMTSSGIFDDENRPTPGPLFERPVLLTTASGPIAQGVLYPSPAMFDIDGDGQDELIVADLSGRVLMAERDEAADTVWKDLVAVQTRHGKALKFSNW